jgi:hypothetical protein
MAKKDVQVNLSEVLVHLRNSGAFRAAVMQVAEAKAGGTDIGTITLNRDGGELSEQDLKAVTGGVTRSLVGSSIPQTAQFKFERVGGGGVIDPGRIALPGFADTTW